MLGLRRGEDGGWFADHRTRNPERAGRVEKMLERRSHVAKSRGASHDQAVALAQVFECRVRRAALRYRRLRDLIEPPDPHKKKVAGMTYARYGLHRYVVAGKKDLAPYNDLVRAGQRLHGLMRTLLFKRLESSVEAFRQTVTRMIERHKIFLRGLDEGFVVAGEQVEDMLKGIE